MNKSINYHLIKLNRFTAWLLLVFMIVFISTGFSIAGEYGFEKLIATNTALALHKKLVWPLLTLFALHVVISAYFSFKRWGWIPSRNK